MTAVHNGEGLQPLRRGVEVYRLKVYSYTATEYRQQRAWYSCTFTRTALYLLSLYLLRIYLSPSKYLPSKISNLVSSLRSRWGARRAVGRDTT